MTEEAMSSNSTGLVGSLITLVIVSIAGGPQARAQEWPQWRGPNRDGAVTGFSAPRAWPERLTPRWKATVGEGHSSPIVAGGRVYLHTRQGEVERVAAYDLETGKQIWEDRYPVAYTMNPAARGHGKGPKSTPVIAAGRLYTLGITGVLSSYDAARGRLLWRKDFAGQFKSTSPIFGTAMSPVVDRGLVIAHVGTDDQGMLAAFDAATGTIKWRWTGDGPGYASPIITEIGGARQIITQSSRNVIGVSAADGKLLWQLPFETEYAQNIVSPLLYRDLIIISGINKGVTAWRVARRGAQWAVDQVWQNKEVSMYMNSPLLSGDRLYGLSHRNRGQYFALDAATGRTLWTSDGRQGENAAMLLSGDLIFALNNEAELIIFSLAGQTPRELKRYKTADSPTWAHPVVAGRRVLIKDATTLAMLSFD
jgi:outer membrane protein assembly factor BamB